MVHEFLSTCKNHLYDSYTYFTNAFFSEFISYSQRGVTSAPDDECRRKLRLTVQALAWRHSVPASQPLSLSPCLGQPSGQPFRPAAPVSLPCRLSWSAIPTSHSRQQLMSATPSAIVYLGKSSYDEWCLIRGPARGHAL